MRYDYIIVGSGIAGLYSAYKLKQKGFKVLILEKNKDPGGRMRSQPIHREYENIGASFIMSSYKHLLALAKELNLNLTQNDGIVDNIGIVDEDNKIIPLKPNLASIKNFSRVPLFQKIKFIALMPMFTRMAFKYSLPDYENLSKFDDESIMEYVSKMVGKEFSKYFLEPAVGNLFSYPAHLFSKAMALGTLKFLIIGRSYYNFKKGLEELPIKISQKVQTKFGMEVDKVIRESSFVRVLTKTGEEFEARRVVMAVPGDKVLNILDKPTQIEKSFFPKVKYSSHIKVFCETNDEQIKAFDRLVFIGDSNIASTNITHKHKDYVRFSFGISDVPARKLIKKGLISNADLKEFIDESINFKLDYKVIKPIIWESALPIYYPGYIKEALKFKKTNAKENKVIFVGDYLSGPFLEGAILSSEEVFQF